MLLTAAKQGVLESLGPRSRREGAGREGGGGGQSPSLTPSFILFLQPTALRPGAAGGTQSDKLIPKALCAASARVLQGEEDEWGENGKAGRRAGSRR